MMFRVLVTIGLLQILTMLVQLVKTKALALLLGPESVGVMAVIDKLLAVIIQTVSLSLPFAAVRFLPALWTKDPRAFRDRYLRMRNVLIVATGAALIGALLVTLVRPITWGAQLLPYRTVLLCALASLPVLALVPFLQNAVAGRLEQNRSMLVALGHAVVLAVAAAGILWKGLSGYYLAYAAVGLVFVTVVSRMTARMPRGVSPPADGPRFPLALPREMWRFSAALLSLTFVTPYAALFVHYRVLRDYGAGTAGWMQAAIGIGLAVRGVLGSAHPVFLTPNVNREGGPADRFAWANAFQATFCFLAGVVLPPLLLFPQIAVRLLYSQAFLPGAAFVSVFVLTEVVILLTGTYQAIVIALDELRFHVAQNVVAQLLMIAVAAWLVTPLGILGAGLAVLAGPLCMYVATTTFLRRRYRLRVPGRLVALSGLLVAGVVASGLVGAHWPEFTLRVIGLKAGVYLAVVGLFSLLLSPDERTRVRGMLAGVRSRLLPAAT